MTEWDSIRKVIGRIIALFTLAGIIDGIILIIFHPQLLVIEYKFGMTSRDVLGTGGITSAIGIFIPFITGIIGLIMGVISSAIWLRIKIIKQKRMIEEHNKK